MTISNLTKDVIVMEQPLFRLLQEAPGLASKAIQQLNWTPFSSGE